MTEKLAKMSEKLDEGQHRERALGGAEVCRQTHFDSGKVNGTL